MAIMGLRVSFYLPAWQNPLLGLAAATKGATYFANKISEH
jgi:hypothetical protein